MLNILSTLFTGAVLTVGSWFGYQPTSTAPIQHIATSATEAASATVASNTLNASLASLPKGSAWLTALTLGDGKYVTTGPKTGYIYVCHVAQGGQGAQGTPTWISGSTWYPVKKVAVSGSVSWPSATYSMKISGSNRLITSNGLPTDHSTGVFPIAANDPAHQFDANPNSVKAQSYSFSLPVSPIKLSTPNCIYGQVGILSDGVPLFDGFDAEYRDAVAHETQDTWEGHPDESGVYHDHGFEGGLVKDAVSTVVGYAFDGFPITGSALPSGTYLHTADLDECHGLTSTVSLDGKNVSIYHYVLTQDFPYSVSCFKGKSYEPKPGGAMGTPGSQSQPMNTSSMGTLPAPPQEAITACSGKTAGASCSVGPMTGTCSTIATYFACKPS